MSAGNAASTASSATADAPRKILQRIVPGFGRVEVFEVVVISKAVWIDDEWNYHVQASPILTAMPRPQDANRMPRT